MVDGKPMPFDSDSIAAWEICLQRTCTQLYKSCLWKCPALAYHAIMSRKLNVATNLRGNSSATTKPVRLPHRMTRSVVSS